MRAVEVRRGRRAVEERVSHITWEIADGYLPEGARRQIELRKAEALDLLDHLLSGLARRRVGDVSRVGGQREDVMKGDRLERLPVEPRPPEQSGPAVREQGRVERNGV